MNSKMIASVVVLSCLSWTSLLAAPAVGGGATSTLAQQPVTRGGIAPNYPLKPFASAVPEPLAIRGSIPSVAATVTDGGPATMLGMGDSLGEGVQSGDASWRTQPYGYLSWLAFQLGAPLQLPLIKSHAFGIVGDTSGRSRLDPTVVADNIAVSGATVSSLLRQRATATSPSTMVTEADLVLYPRQLSQIEIAEASAARWIICWIGNNDVLSAVNSFQQLDATQMTSVASFAADYQQLATRLQLSNRAFDRRVVFANIPNVTSIATLLDGNDLTRLMGQDYGLPVGDYTTVMAMMLVRSGLATADIFSDPAYILDSREVALINARISAFNKIIAREASRIGAALVDINTAFKEMSRRPPSYLGLSPSNRFLGGYFSLDGIHPSNIGHALIANEFVRTINSFYGTRYAPIDALTLQYLFLTDPSIDKDGDNRVTGRPFAGFIETLWGLVGLAPDSNDYFYNP